jgi:hypothetical protein
MRAKSRHHAKVRQIAGSPIHLARNGGRWQGRLEAMAEAETWGMCMGGWREHDELGPSFQFRPTLVTQIFALQQEWGDAELRDYAGRVFNADRR